MYTGRRVDNIHNHGYEIHVSQTTSMTSGRSNWSIFIIHERATGLGSNNTYQTNTSQVTCITMLAVNKY